MAADILRTLPEYESKIFVHMDYGLPNVPEEILSKSLVVASSYSGNTEEVIDSLNTALEKRLAVACIAVGGKLLEIARENKLPLIQLPDWDLQPRSALGLSFMALVKLIGDDKLFAEAEGLSQSLSSGEFEDLGKNLAEKAKGKILVIYSSAKKWAVAYNWKTKINENAKAPAFCNVIPEMNHNEINSFEIPTLSEKFYFLFLEDSYDHPRVQKRMSVMADLFVQKRLKVEKIRLSGQNHFHKIFSSLILSDWVSFYLAGEYGLDPEQVPMVEKFKGLIA